MISGKKSCVACNIYVDMHAGGSSSLFLWMAISPLPLEGFSATPEKENVRSQVAVNNGLVCCYDCSSEGALWEMWMWRMRLEGSEKRLSQ